MTLFDERDYFTDPSYIPDPQPYFDHLRAQGSVVPTHRGVIAVTALREAQEVYRDPDTYSSAVAAGGPFPPLPFTPTGDDINAQLDAHRSQLPLSEHMVVQDPPQHTRARSLLARLLTAKRLKENQDFLWKLADRQLDEFIDSGRTEILGDYAKPFSMLAIADLLGVPHEDHPEFKKVLAEPHLPGNLEGTATAVNPLEFLDEKFRGYIEQRRVEPRDDVLTELATAKYPDGATPEVSDVIRTATFLFGAGQETTARLLSAAMHFLAENPELQRQVREDRSLIPGFIEETLRMESPVKTTFRLVRKSTTLNGVDLPAGTIVMISPSALNRDPERFENPHAFELNRPNVRDHVAFSRGVHSCPGAPLARVEGRVSLERILTRLLDITVDEEHHGPAEARRYNYEPTFVLRGLSELNLRFTQA